ncbi:MAG: glycosyltransferase family 1 protein [Kiritimatiellae bacterium]|nr:glycosyltransferase family 1 protein [Kiritimatiellia bacterium]
MRILLVDNLLIRRYGKLRMGPGRALACGAIRGNHRLCEFSDRDLARYMGFGIRALGERLVNKALIKTAKNFRPDAILLGHCDFIRNSTLDAIREVVPGVKIAHFNVDPMCDAHPQEQMRERMYSCDALFATTAGEEYLKPFVTGKNVVAYMPNPADTALETLDNSTRASDDFSFDIFYAGQPRLGDPRLAFVNRLSAELADKPIRFELIGMGNRPAVVGGAEYDDLLASAKMGLNINRYFGMKWYSSDRIAHLMGSGILTAVYDGDQMQDFFSDKEVLYYHDVPDLVEKLIHLQQNDTERQAIAAAGRARYHKIFSGERILNFMLETLFNRPYSSDYEWTAEIYR